MIEPIPVEKKLATEVKIRDVIACTDIEKLKNYTTPTWPLVYIVNITECLREER